MIGANRSNIWLRALGSVAMARRDWGRARARDLKSRALRDETDQARAMLPNAQHHGTSAA
jgi:hypothetical protein